MPMRRNYKKRPASKKRVGVRKPLVKTITKVVQAVERRQMETKYVAINRTDNTPVGATASTPANFIPLTCLMTQGVADNQRIGDSIRPIVCKAHFTFYFDTTTTNNADLLVNFWVVKSKSAKGPAQINSLTGGNFLKLGTSNNVDPTNPSQPSQLTLVPHYPLNTDAYTPLMHKVFRMRKGQGNSAGVSVVGDMAPTGTLASEDLRTISYSWKPAVHQYDTSVAAPYTNLPVNDCPVALIWCTNADGSGGTHNLLYGLRTECFYKDA